MGNYKNPNVIDVIISGNNTIQGKITVTQTPTGKWGSVGSGGSGINPPNPQEINATVVGRTYLRLNTEFDNINYYN